MVAARSPRASHLAWLCLFVLLAEPSWSEREEGCAELAVEGRQACRDELRTGASLGCRSLRVALDLARRSTDPAVADASCGVHLRSLRKRRARQQDDPQPIEWGPECRSYVTWFDAHCIEPMGVAPLPAQCGGALSLLERAKGSPEAGEAACSAGMVALPDSALAASDRRVRAATPREGNPRG